MFLGAARQTSSSSHTIPHIVVFACSVQPYARQTHDPTRTHTSSIPHVPPCPDARSLPITYGHLHSVLVLAQISHARSHTNPHVLDPTRPRAPPCGQSCRLTRPPTLLARTPRRHSSLHGAAALHHTTSHSSLDATQPPQCPFSGPYTIGPPVLLLLLLLQQLRCYSNFENDNLRFSSGLFSTPAVCVLRTT